MVCSNDNDSDVRALAIVDVEVARIGANSAVYRRLYDVAAAYLAGSIYLLVI